MIGLCVPVLLMQDCPKNDCPILQQAGKMYRIFQTFRTILRPYKTERHTGRSLQCGSSGTAEPYKKAETKSIVSAFKITVLKSASLMSQLFYCNFSSAIFFSLNLFATISLNSA